MPVYVTLLHPDFHTMLSLARTPKLLRFVSAPAARCGRGLTWDALDQLDDEPRRGESITAAVEAGRTAMHVDVVRRGRRVGENAELVRYLPIAAPPAVDVLRDTEAWRAWCLRQDLAAVLAAAREEAAW